LSYYNYDVYTVELAGAVQQDLPNSIAGGLDATATITSGLILIPSGGTKEITVGIIAAGGTHPAKTMIIGLGKSTITVPGTCDEDVTAVAMYTPKFLLLFFLLR